MNTITYITVNILNSTQGLSVPVYVMVYHCYDLLDIPRLHAYFDDFCLQGNATTKIHINVNKINVKWNAKYFHSMKVRVSLGKKNNGSLSFSS